MPETKYQKGYSKITCNKYFQIKQQQQILFGKEVFYSEIVLQ